MTYREFQESANQTELDQGLSRQEIGSRAPASRSNLIPGIGVGLLLGLGLAFVGGRLANRPAAEPPAAAATAAAASVTVQRAQLATIQQSLRATGTVQAFDLLQISPQLGNLQIREVRVREGNQVVAGQVLAVLDDAVLRSQISQAKANVAQAKAQVAQAQAGLAQAEASAAEAEENYRRYQALEAQGAISAEELISRRTQATTAREAVGVAQADIRSAEATVTSRQAEVERLQTQLAQTVVKAPASGQIAERQATVGDTSSTSTPLFSLIQNDLLELVVDLPQQQLSAIASGTPVTVTSTADSSLQITGSVRTIDPQVNAQTRQALVKVSLPSSDRIRPGMFLQAEFTTGQRQGLVIPEVALLPRGNDQVEVFTVDADDQAVPVAVTLGTRLPATAAGPERVEILSGLEAGTPVVVEGAAYLQPGDTVSIVPTPTPNIPGE